MAEVANCPHCAVPLLDGGVTHVIGVEIRGVYDGVLFWMCSACGGTWHRWSADNEHMRAKAQRVMDRWAETK